ncbi:phosphoenolpyruvate carboxykinase [Athalassotoga saccharophila]|uniref:phosphoenolpyruvate carboxykinase n=1 Tax=Athalassotoga saccharophila TaxID=1441386 RepID=UPI001379978B|nr:phosphoenolpyruvate carboxykinase [Athalassotoga saccharophila]BBJ28564.1 phosphoenolpyruvate carboxykinase (ATP) [Athalassotoga saccharophila]
MTEINRLEKYIEFPMKPDDKLNPTLCELWEMAKVYSVPNNAGLPLFYPKVKSRSAKFTKNYEIDDPEAQKYLKDVQDFVKNNEMIKVEARIGEGSELTFRSRLFVSAKYPQLAYMFKKNLFEPNGEEIEQVDVITIPEYPERKVLVFPKEGVEVILGSDYYGETKMAALRLAMYIAREKHGALGLHAGSKAYNLKINSEMKHIGVLIFGLSGTGKTTLVCATHDLKTPESIEIIQDDINFIDQNLFAWGSEKNFYIKTEGITSQPLLFEAAKSTGSILENVYVNEKGEIDFDNLSISSNGRAIVEKDKIPYSSKSYRMGKVDVLFFNTRRDDLPPILKIDSVEKAAAIFALGESTITSADDPQRAGQPVRTVGFNPFIIDDPAKEVNTFKSALKGKEFKAFIVNTGYIGGWNGLKIKPADTFNFVEKALRDEIKFEYDPLVGFEVPVEVEGMDISKFKIENFYSKEEYAQKMKRLRAERLEFLKTLDGLDKDIVESI